MLLTKLHIPAAGDNLVQRNLLFEKLNLGLKRKLILVSAPAGFGKTTILSHWIHSYNINAAWFSVDAHDNDSTEFLSYIIAAIQTQKADFGVDALELLQSPANPSPEVVVNLLLNDLVAINTDFVLVFDDFHLISNQEIIRAMSYLLEYLPPNIHVALLSRSDPNLPIARLRSQQQLIEFRSADLSFSTTDIASLFNKKLKTKLSEHDIKALERKTEGWIAGLQLAALSMQGYNDSSEFIQAFAGNNRYIMDYLMEEVLKIQSENIKDFLLHTSFLSQFSADICNFILERDDSQLILEKLEADNMFVIPLDNERYWYRYHHLFADLLKQRFLLAGKQKVKALHEKACQWYEENEMYDMAIHHAFKAENLKHATFLVGKTIEDLWQKGQHNSILEYGKLLPDEYIFEDPDFCLYYGWVLISSGQMQRAETYLIPAKNKIEALLNKQSDKNLQKALAKISVALAYLYSHNQNADKTFAHCQVAMKYLTDADPLWYSWGWFSYGVSYFAIGELQKSREAFDKAYEYSIKSGNIYQMSSIAIRMAENEQQLGHYKSAFEKCSNLLQIIEDKGYGEIAKKDWTYAGLYFIMGTSQFVWTETDKAVENIKLAYELSKDSKDIYLKFLTLMVYSFILKEQKNPDMEKKIAELNRILENEEVPPFLRSMYVGWQSYLLMEKNELEKAFNILDKQGISLDGVKDTSNDSTYMSLARLLVMQGKYNDAEKLINELEELAISGQRIERVIELKILKAYYSKLINKRELAIDLILESMEMASRENLLSYYVYNINQINDLLDGAMKKHALVKTSISQSFIDNLKIALSRRKKENITAIDTGLSSRELDTLHLIAEGLINQDIADKLFISLNTVKTHVKNILLKLEVDNRTKAVNKAKEMGII